MQLFYQPKLLVNTTQILNEEESRHCAQVLRLKSGDIINITNGNGSFFTAELIDVNKTRVYCDNKNRCKNAHSYQKIMMFCVL